MLYLFLFMLTAITGSLSDNQFDASSNVVNLGLIIAGIPSFGGPPAKSSSKSIAYFSKLEVHLGYTFNILSIADCPKSSITRKTRKKYLV